MSQLDLFDNTDTERPDKIGHSNIYYKDASTLLTKTSGFMADYDFSLNPYSGCAFGCSYCYAAFFTMDKTQFDDWGYWVNVKQNALTLLRKFRKKPLSDKNIYMSSVTDPYQPVERKTELTRSILKELLEYHQPRLVIQTRGTLVTRDIDLLKQFKNIQVNMTVTTDSELVRKTFEPLCSNIESRLDAIKKVNDAGVQSCITMTPLLPVDNAHLFAQKLLDTGIKNFVIQPFHKDRGKFTAGTRQAALELFQKYQWDEMKYKEIENIIKQYIPSIGVGKDGFAPI
jgi:DNA repair photolyase